MMLDFIQDGTKEELLLANEANCLSYVRTYSAIDNVEMVENEKIMMAVSPVDGVSMINNFVSKSILEEGEVDGVLGRFKEAGRPVMWTVSPNTAPPDMSDVLKKKKMIHFDSYALMHCDMSSLEDASGLAEGLEIWQVNDFDTFTDWVHLNTISFGLTGGIRDITIKDHARLFLDSTLPGYHFICYLNGKPAGTSTVYIADGVAGIYNITTAPEARGRGVGEAVTRQAMIAGKKAGCVFATLQATKMGRPVYEKIGYESVASNDIFVKMYGKSLIKMPATLLQRSVGNQLRKLFFS